MKIGESKIINETCPLCGGSSYQIDKWNDNLYLLKCLEPNSVSSQWVKRVWKSYWQPVAVDMHPPKYR